METEESKAREAGGERAKKDEWEEKEDGIRGLCCRLQGADVARGTVLLQHRQDGVIHRGKAGHGSPRQQVGQDSPFSASLPQHAEPCPGCPAASLLPNTVYSLGDWQNTRCAFAAQLARRD